MSRLFPVNLGQPVDAMVFVDGENLAIRYGSMLAAKGLRKHDSVQYLSNTYVWPYRINNACINGHVKRKHLYTSVVGDEPLIVEIETQLKKAGIEAPRVFKRTKSRASKRVDISLTTEMLTHGARRNYEIAVLIAGDEDYVPLVEAVQMEGRRVYVWFLEDGISPVLARTADYYADLWEILSSENMTDWR